MKFTPIRRVDNRLVLLAQSKLPLDEEYLELDDYRDIIAAIKRLDVRGAPAIGIAAAYGVAVAACPPRNLWATRPRFRLTSKPKRAILNPLSSG